MVRDPNDSTARRANPMPRFPKPCTSPNPRASHPEKARAGRGINDFRLDGRRRRRGHDHFRSDRGRWRVSDWRGLSGWRRLRNSWRGRDSRSRGHRLLVANRRLIHGRRTGHHRFLNDHRTSIAVIRSTNDATRQDQRRHRGHSQHLQIHSHHKHEFGLRHRQNVQPIERVQPRCPNGQATDRVELARSAGMRAELPA
jgi:hypothetical protein